MNELTNWDVTWGDCTLSHFRLKAPLGRDTRKIGNVRFVCPGTCKRRTGTFLCGISKTGCVFELEVGILKVVWFHRFVRPSSVCQSRDSLKPPKYIVEDEKKSWSKRQIATY